MLRYSGQVVAGRDAAHGDAPSGVEGVGSGGAADSRKQRNEAVQDRSLLLGRTDAYRIDGRAAHAVCSSKCTVRPIAVAMLTSASIEKRDTRPRSKSFMRGCVMPQRAAASV